MTPTHVLLAHLRFVESITLWLNGYGQVFGSCGIHKRDVEQLALRDVMFMR